MAIDAVGISISPILAGLGIGGLAVALAVKQVFIRNPLQSSCQKRLLSQ